MTKLGHCVIVGCARDVEHMLVRTVLPDIQRLRRMFETSSVYIYENDSVDGTLRVLENTPNITVISETNVPGTRTERLARGRNLLRMAADKYHPHADWMIMMDLDFHFSHDFQGLSKVIEHMRTNNINVASAVSSHYYDYWALRHRDADFVGDCMDRRKDTFWDWLKPNKCSQWGFWEPKGIVSVQSAFNGLAVYNMKRVRSSNCVYVGRHRDGRGKCEHVAFHQCLGRVIVDDRLRTTMWDRNRYVREFLTKFNCYKAELVLCILCFLVAAMNHYRIFDLFRTLARPAAWTCLRLGPSVFSTYGGPRLPRFLSFK
jgi:hypothetical protein